ncbi:MAG TPA: diaminopimelate decarboxylase [Kofleriaceae bacterium]|nr:diaminopimelate decarboxylase [Kofleriaceae bacterium]
MNHFHYREGELHCEEVPLARIAAEVGTPVYVYSTATIERHYRVFDEALAGLDHLICFSVKACSNLSILRLLFGMGAGADIVSGGELARVQRAGGRGDRVVFSGVGKTDDEMRQALAAGVLAFNVESEPELRVLNDVAAAAGARARVSLRVNPDVDAQTHPYISTGLKNNKFGIAWRAAPDAYRLARSLPNIEVVGVDCHIGSQLTRTAPFSDAIGRLVELVQGLARDGIAIRYLDIGGGLGIPYGKEEEPEPPTPGEYGQAIERALAPLSDMKLTVLCEPGRVIVGNAGVLITKVLYDKPSEAKRFLVVDAAMNDLMRPALYGSFHPMRPVVERPERERAIVDVVGPICETGDFLARDREMALLARGELLSIGAAGAYGFTMSSNYNTRPRAAEVLVAGSSYQVVRRRETLDQLLASEE